MSKQPWWKGAKGEWYVVVQFLLLGLTVFGPTTLPGWPAWSGVWRIITVVVGLVVGGVGGLFIMSGLFSLGSNLTAVPRPKEDAFMVVHGAYGIVLGAFGLGFLRGGWLGLLYALILFIFFDIKSRREEVWLREKYADYADYQQRVSKLVPFVY
jgi:protein-S-isoprenylcysteine O-methyltransferase Ste14